MLKPHQMEAIDRTLKNLEDQALAKRRLASARLQEGDKDGSTDALREALALYKDADTLAALLEA